jgi:hypothetical protein
MKSKVAGFYAARSRTIPPLPWPSFAPPFSGMLLMVDEERSDRQAASMWLDPCV